MQGKPWAVVECVFQLRRRCLRTSKQFPTIGREEFADKVADLRATAFATIELKEQDPSFGLVQPCREWSVFRVPDDGSALNTGIIQHRRVHVHLLDRQRVVRMGCFIADPWRPGPSGEVGDDHLIRVPGKDNSLHFIVPGSWCRDACHDLVEFICLGFIKDCHIDHLLTQNAGSTGPALLGQELGIGISG